MYQAGMVNCVTADFEASSMTTAFRSKSRTRSILVGDFNRRRDINTALTFYEERDSLDLHLCLNDQTRAKQLSVVEVLGRRDTDRSLLRWSNNQLLKCPGPRQKFVGSLDAPQLIHNWQATRRPS